MACQLEDTGTGAGVARRQDGLWRVWECLPVCPRLVQMERNTAGVSRSPGIGRSRAGLKVQKVRRLVYIDSKPPPETSYLLVSSPGTLLA